MSCLSPTAKFEDGTPTSAKDAVATSRAQPRANVVAAAAANILAAGTHGSVSESSRSGFHNKSGRLYTARYAPQFLLLRGQI